LKSIILYRYGALLQVDAKAENGQLFSLEWRPDGNSLQVEIQPSTSYANKENALLR
jgi:hypothetical protein